ncbi:MAG: uncharacterized protein V7636_2079 [Actinomycetota bacterium]
MAPPLWVLEGESARTFLFGQAPWGVRESEPWLEGAQLDAFAGSRELWCEIPDDPRLADGDLIARFGLSSTCLSADLDVPALARVTAAADTVGVKLADLETCRPWLAAQILDNVLRDGVDDVLVDAEGVLTERARETGKRVAFEFADAEAVLTFFAGPAEVEYLCCTAERVALGPADELARLSRPWLDGDLGPFDDEVRSMQAWPQFFDRMLRARNHAWLPRFDAARTASADTFFLMGMAHIVGDEGVIALLRERGCTVERVQ